MQIGIGAAAVLLFGLWLRRQETLLSAGTVLAFFSLCLFTMTSIIAISRLADCMVKTDSFRPETPDTRSERLAAWGLLLLFGIIISLLQYTSVYLLSDPGTDFCHSFRPLYYRSDVAHYMGIARDWYAREGDERLRLVFFPLYPLLIRAFTWNGDYFTGALIVSQLFSLACLPAAYELFRLDMDRRGAMACARILFLLPGAAFLRVPMSEGLFLFLTLLAVYHARKHQFFQAGLFTALSAFTRSLGVLLLGLLFVEMAFAFVQTYREDRRRAFRQIPGFAGCLLLGCCGTVAYLAVNRAISGSPFTFLTYQRENWNQGPGLFFNTAAYQAEYMLLYLENGDTQSVLSLSLPNLLCAFGTLGLLHADRKQMRISYLLWALVYYALSIGATWLLSGPRYLAMVFPLALSLRRLCKAPAAEHGLESALLMGQTAYLLMLALDMYVY